ncbi:MAG TPA: hypothetical protein VGH54_11445 [Mycobacterium sp.]|jgi:hypothetical protein|uniref:hypothetical protein n=1 Tax=Mycobacterium sp. TaxID=1785 RepID=UPI002F3E50D5
MDTTVTYLSFNGSDRLTENDVRAYLAASGYSAEADAVTAECRRFPCSYKYTGDRHRFAVYIMPGGYWKAGDCEASEERIKSFGRGRRGIRYGGF